MKKLVMVIGFLAVSATSVYARQQPPRGGEMGPPPEAYEACEGKQQGDSAQFTTHFGDTMTGTCQILDGKLVLVPADRPQGNMPPQ